MFPSFVLLGREVYSYNLCAGLGAIAALLTLLRIAGRRGLEPFVIEIAMWAAVPAVIGGSLLFGLTNLGYLCSVIADVGGFSSLWDLLRAIAVAFGGSVFYGGLLGALLGVLAWTRRNPSHRAGDVFDLCAVGVPLFHGFGRIGCFLGGCCFGVPCDMGIAFERGMVAVANGVPRFPVQLLESALEFCLFAVMLRLFVRERLRGRLLGVWAASYAVVRFLDEFLRGDAYRGFWGPLSTSQWISLALLAVVLVRWASQGGAWHRRP